jgi:hypothetical protein
MTMLSLQEELESIAGKKLALKINDNHSTMLSVRWEPDCTKVSLHRMFLKAPQNVMQELACYLRQENPVISPSVKAFIEDNLKKFDYSHTINQRKLYQQGNVYNLQKIYDEVNDEYFDKKLKLFITWFGKHNQRNRSRVTFGLYHDPLKLIKIHRRLDTPSFPAYFISYVIYHEMLHFVCPAYIDEKGLNRIHSKEFKKREIQFRHYDLAQSWIKEHQANFFD